MFDVVVVGGGIAGLFSAYWLQQGGADVLLVDKGPLLGRASGAAGAFLSPRLGKGSYLQAITNEAYRFSLDFYRTRMPHCLFQKGLVRAAKDEREAQAFASYARYLDLPYSPFDPNLLPEASEALRDSPGFYFPDAAFVDPECVAQSLRATIRVAERIPAVSVMPEDGGWRVGEYQARNVVLATGADPLPMPCFYLPINRLWGERADILSDLPLGTTLHRGVSVSGNIDGIVRIGATHYRFEVPGERPDAGRIQAMLDKAVACYPGLQGMRIYRLFGGYRSALDDHLPALGELADFGRTFENVKKLGKADTPPSESVVRESGAFFVGAFGGRGFVFAPLMGQIVADRLLEGKPIPGALHTDRYLWRRIKRSKNVNHSLMNNKL